MRTLRTVLVPFAALALAGVSALAQKLESVTYIEPAKSFLLGGGQPGAFSVKGKNIGTVAVTVFAERRGTRDSLVTLAPGGTVDAEFPSGAAAVFRNESTGLTAQMSLTVRGRIDGLGMRYEPARR